MELLAGAFGISLIVISLIITYRLGIKPDRAARKQRENDALAEMRRLHWEQSQKRRARTT
jgi:hypothetical protein